jgi:hypothetical protein
MALFSFWSVFVSPLICFGCLFAVQNQRGPFAHWVGKIAPFFGALGIVSGFAVGWIALVKNRRLPSKSVSMRSIFGIAGNGLWICFVVVLVCYSLKTYNKQLLAETPEDRAARFYHQSVIRNYNLQTLLHDSASRQLGDTNIAMEAANKTLQKQQVLTKEFYSAAQPVNRLRLLDMSNVENPKDLRDRKELLQRFLEANDRFWLFTTNAEFEYDNELVAQGVSQTTRDYFVKKFHEGWGAGVSSYGKPNEIFKANDLWAQYELQALSFLETNWAKWSYDESLKKTKFKDDSLIEDYNKLIEEINRYYQERKRLQQEILSKQNQ